MFMLIGVEEVSMSSVVSLGIPGLVALFGTALKITGSFASIPGAVAYVLPGATSVLPVRFSIGYDISVLK